MALSAAIPPPADEVERELVKDLAALLVNRGTALLKDEAGEALLRSIQTWDELCRQAGRTMSFIVIAPDSEKPAWRDVIASTGSVGGVHSFSGLGRTPPPFTTAGREEMKTRGVLLVVSNLLSLGENTSAASAADALISDLSGAERGYVLLTISGDIPIQEKAEALRMLRMMRLLPPLGEGTGGPSARALVTRQTDDVVPTLVLTPAMEELLGRCVDLGGADLVDRLARTSLPDHVRFVLGLGGGASFDAGGVRREIERQTSVSGPVNEDQIGRMLRDVGHPGPLRAESDVRAYGRSVRDFAHLLLDVIVLPHYARPWTEPAPMPSPEPAPEPPKPAKRKEDTKTRVSRIRRCLGLTSNKSR